MKKLLIVLLVFLVLTSGCITAEAVDDVEDGSRLEPEDVQQQREDVTIEAMIGPQDENCTEC